MTTVRCYYVNNQTLCVDDFAKNIINLTKRTWKRLTVCEYEKLLEEIHEANAKELIVTEIEKHRYEIRTYYRIYRVAVAPQRYRYFMEIFDGSSAMYEYVFCRTKTSCLQEMKKREQGNKMLY